MTTRKGLRAVLCAVTVLLVQSASATNYPCSGRKGGISHCEGSTFICNDGSVSASRKDCRAYTGAGGASRNAPGLMGSSATEMQPSPRTDCSCREGQYCVGPRGGHYCMTDSGKKSYLRK